MVGRKTRDRILVIISSLTLLAVVSVMVYRRRTAPPAVAENRSIPVYTVHAEKSDLRNTLVISSFLETESSVTVVPRISGTITELLIEEGTEVKAGEILARIESEPYRLEMQSAESAWLLAENSYTRIEKLHEGAGASRQQVEELDTARKSALSSYELAKMRYGYSEVRAPINGLVLGRYADVGSLASPGQPLFVIGENDDYRIRVAVPEKHWPRFSGNGKIAVRVWPADLTDTSAVRAEILRMSPSISPTDRTFRVTCSLDPKAAAWPIGSRLATEFILENRENVWSLPVEVLGGGSEVWSVDESRKIALPAEDPGLFRDRNRMEIPDDWSNRTFILVGHHRLAEGVSVTAFPADGD